MAEHRPRCGGSARHRALLLTRCEAELRAEPGSPGPFAPRDTATLKPCPSVQRCNRTALTELRCRAAGSSAGPHSHCPSHLPPARPPWPLALSIPSPAVTMGPRPPRPTPASPLPLATELGTEARRHWPEAQHATCPLATVPLSEEGRAPPLRRGGAQARPFCGGWGGPYLALPASRAGVSSYDEQPRTAKRSLRDTPFPEEARPNIPSSRRKHPLSIYGISQEDEPAVAHGLA